MGLDDKKNDIDYICFIKCLSEMKMQVWVEHPEQLHIQFLPSATADRTSSCTITIVHDHTSC